MAFVASQLVYAPWWLNIQSSMQQKSFMVPYASPSKVSSASVSGMPPMMLLISVVANSWLQAQSILGITSGLVSPRRK